mmetsp:Transcript_7143/g.11229  ORF Transcript_7143/g.11229 Transcript_7143/m.11229 type:complete len:195 (+) Transcript_7143:80-664(+)
MKATKNKPPGLAIPPKVRFLAGDLKRNRALFQCDILPMPANFFSEVSRNILRLQRVLVAAQAHDVPREKIESLITAFTKAVHLDRSFRDSKNNLTIDNQLICKCMQTAGICEKDVTILLTWSNSRMAKDMVRANTEEAVNLGAFGAPSFYVQNAPKPFQKPFLLFGSDRFEQLTYILNLKWHGVARQLLHNSKL